MAAAVCSVCVAAFAVYLNTIPELDAAAVLIEGITISLILG